MKFLKNLPLTFLILSTISYAPAYATEVNTHRLENAIFDYDSLPYSLPQRHPSRALFKSIKTAAEKRIELGKKSPLYKGLMGRNNIGQLYSQDLIGAMDTILSERKTNKSKDKVSGLFNTIKGNLHKLCYEQNRRSSDVDGVSITSADIFLHMGALDDLATHFKIKESLFDPAICNVPKKMTVGSRQYYSYEAYFDELMKAIPKSHPLQAPAQASLEGETSTSKIVSQISPKEDTELRSHSKLGRFEGGPNTQISIDYDPKLSRSAVTQVSHKGSDELSRALNKYNAAMAALSFTRPAQAPACEQPAEDEILEELVDNSHGLASDPLELLHLLENTNLEHYLQLRAKVLAKIQKGNSECRYDYPSLADQWTKSRTQLEKVATSFGCMVAAVIPQLKEVLGHYGDHEFYKNGQGGSQLTINAYNYLKFDIGNTKRLSYLKQLYPEGHLSEEEWGKITEILGEINKNNDSITPAIQEFFTSAEFYQDLKTAVGKIEQIAESGDTIVGVGNTPQFVLTALEHADKKFNLIPVAISGWPGRIKRESDWVSGTITPKGLKNYQKYLDQIGLAPGKHHKKIFLLDIVGEGGGLEFLAQQIRNKYKEKAQQAPEIVVIALNSIADQFVGKTLTLDAHSLKLDQLARRLDRVTDTNRAMISFPAYMWDSWSRDPLTTPPADGAKHIIEGIHQSLGK